MTTARTLTFKYAFVLPMALIFILMTLTSLLIEGMRKGFVLKTAGPEFLSEAAIGVYILGALVFLILISIAKRVAVHHIILSVFLGFPILIGIFALAVVPFVEDLNQSMVIIRYWPLTVYYVLTTYWMSGSYFFFWVFANNHFSFRQAGFCYPIFRMIFLIMNVYVRNWVDIFMNWYHNTQFKFFVVNLLVLIIGLLIFSAYALISRRLPRIQHESDNRCEEINRLFGVRYLIIIGIIDFAISYLGVLTAKEFGLMSYFREETISWQIISVYLLIPLAFILYIFRGKGWRFAAYIVTALIVGTFLISWTALHFSVPWGKDIHPLFMAGGLGAFALILKEMSFIAVPQKTRLLTKTWVDIFFWGLGSLGVFFAFPALTLLLLLLYLLSIHYTGVRLEKFAP